jgi:hypothetical protein
MKTIRRSLYHKVDAEDSKGDEGQEQGKYRIFPDTGAVSLSKGGIERG